MRSGRMQFTQSGIIPPDAQSIRFTAAPYSSLAGISASLYFELNGGIIPIIALDEKPAYTTWGADVSAYAGQVAQIGFDVEGRYPFAGTAEPHVFLGIGLDNIEFSPTPIPEPASKQILAAGLVCFW